MTTTPNELPALVLHTADQRGVHTLVLNRPSTFNALSEDMMADIQAKLDAIAKDTAARAVVVAATGKAFCAGHNLKDMLANLELAYYQKLFAQCTRMMLSIQNLGLPVIAKVQGVATAAGCQLVAQCDLAVASSNASFGVNGIDVGLFCATPSVPLSRNIPAKQAMEMLLTGGFLTADEAMHAGLVNRVAAHDVPGALDLEVENLVSAIVARPREAIAMGKALFYKQRETNIEAAYQLAGQTMACNMAHPVAQEGVQAFIEKRKPSWPA
jgi:enoyl-CoA hydratase/carnithine racemase